jgi:bifunctional N-acetylglucosamine-1-phosphate-uridyltransferase/glucosamine-1-phosphate-acetyltransferase GlmU-like protein
MLDWLLHLYSDWVERVVVVVHPAFAEQVRAFGAGIGVPLEYEIQSTPTGMLDAILLARRRIAESEVRHVWVTWCDQVAIHPRTVATLAQHCDSFPEAPLVLPIAHRHHPYVHLERDSTGRIARVLHRREGDRIPDVGETEMGLFSLSRTTYMDWLPEFASAAEAGETTGERNFLPFIPWVAARGDVMTFDCVDEMEAVGVNTPDELRLVERYLATRGGV